jgi:hypothetical protein
MAVILLTIGRLFQRKGNDLSSMKKCLSILIVASLIAGCERPQNDVVQYINGKQVLNMNTLSRAGSAIDKIDLTTSLPDTIRKGEELHARIFLPDKRYKIADAFYNCKVNSKSLVDTLSKRIDGCRDGLIVEDDTVEIYLTAGNVEGWKQFYNITVLSVDSDRVYRYHNGTFKYYVK